MRRWCRAHTKRGQAKHLADFNREFALNAFLRTIGWAHQEFYHWLAGEEKIPGRVARTMSAFIGKWEAGLIEFTPYRNKVKRTLVHLEKPRLRRSRLTLDLDSGAPRLRLVSRAPLAPAMPSFQSLIGPRNLTRGK